VTPLQRLAMTRIREALPGMSVISGPATERIEGSGATVVEVFDTVAWSAPRHTAECRVLHLNILSDCTRTEYGEPQSDDADANAWAVYENLQGLFHDVGRQWADVVSSVRADGPTLTKIPDSEFAVLLTARYEVMM
jgi:hypothetical protein